MKIPKRTVIVLSLPHPFDATLNFALGLVAKQVAGSADTRVLTHADTSQSPVYAHLRRSINDVPPRGRLINEALRWAETHLLPHEHVGLYNRHTLCDLTTPFRSRKIWELVQILWLYGFKRDIRFVFVDFGKALGGSRLLGQHAARDAALKAGQSLREAEAAGEAYRAGFDGTVDILRDKVGNIFGKDRFEVLQLEQVGDLQPMVSRFETMFRPTDGAVRPPVDLPALEKHLARMVAEHKPEPFLPAFSSAWGPVSVQYRV